MGLDQRAENDLRRAGREQAVADRARSAVIRAGGEPDRQGERSAQGAAIPPRPRNEVERARSLEADER